MIIEDNLVIQHYATMVRKNIGEEPHKYKRAFIGTHVILIGKY